jgi:CDP-glucose 4,6-dehydratase
VRHLLELSADVVCLVRDRVPQSSFVREGLSDRVTLVRGDVCDEPLLERALNEHGS